MNRNDELKQKLRDKFLKASREVWENFDKTNIDFEFEITPPQRTHARVIIDSNAKPKSIGNLLLRVPKKAKIQAGTDLFNLKEEIIDKIIKHEAIHIGNMQHNRDFERLARKVGTGISMRQIQGLGYGLEVKKGNRFKEYKVGSKIETFDDALNLGKELSKKLNAKVRILE